MFSECRAAQTDFRFMLVHMPLFIERNCDGRRLGHGDSKVLDPDGQVRESTVLGKCCLQQLRRREYLVARRNQGEPRRPDICDSGKLSRRLGRRAVEPLLKKAVKIVHFGSDTGGEIHECSGLERIKAKRHAQARSP